MAYLTQQLYRCAAIYARSSRKRFEKSLHDPAEAQKKVLLKILRANDGTQFSKYHDLKGVASIRGFRKALPIFSYEDYLPWIEKIRSGEKHVLSALPPSHLCPTSGNPSGQKSIPYNSTLVQEFMAGVLPWLNDLFHQYPKITQGRAYWIMTPNTLTNESSFPERYEKDTSYFGPIFGAFLKRLLVCPESLREVHQANNSIYLTLYHLLGAADLSWISLWNPSAFSSLWAELPVYSNSIVKDIHDGNLSCPEALPSHFKNRLRLKKNPSRARALEKNYFKTEKIWPRLSLISCWTDGWAALSVDALKEIFPGVPVQGKGLLATEGLISIPFNKGVGSVLGICSHYLEFEDTDTQEIFGAEELVLHKQYAVILTQGAGLYRYRLGDLIEVVGFSEKTPNVRFLRREAEVVDIVGEKMNSTHVEKILSTLYQKHKLKPMWSFLTPVQKGVQWSYTLIISNSRSLEGKIELLKFDLENLLKNNYHYRHGRHMKQLTMSQVLVSDTLPPKGVAPSSVQKVDSLQAPSPWIQQYIKEIS